MGLHNICGLFYWFIFVAFMIIVTSKLNSWSFVTQDINIIAVTLNWILIIPNFIDLFMFFYSEMIKSMGSVERVIFNVDKTTIEGELYDSGPVPFDSRLGIEVHNIYCRYRPGLPFVLKGLSLNIKNNEKVALVGRTGSGKSSFLLALTRGINVENSINFPKICKYQNLQKDPKEYRQYLFILILQIASIQSNWVY